MTTFGLFGPIGPTELLIILVIIVIIFGAKRLPEIGKGIGKSIREFKEETSKIHEEPAKAEEQEKDAKKES